MDKEAGLQGSGVFDELLGHSRLVFRICLGFASDLDEAEELCQEIYLKAWSDIHSLRKRDSAKPWLLKIARNIGLNYVRKRRSNGRLIAGSQLPLVENETPEASILLKERYQVFKNAIRRLPQKFRIVFVLREYGALSYEEIAETMGIRLGTVMSRLNRARRAITEEIKGKGYGGSNE